MIFWRVEGKYYAEKPQEGFVDGFCWFATETAMNKFVAAHKWVEPPLTQKMNVPTSKAKLLDFLNWIGAAF